jgi:small subunit ribosomal protein S16
MPRADPYGDPTQKHKDINIDMARASYWIGVGAQPTDTMWRLLSMAGLLPKKHFGPTMDKAPAEVKTADVRIQ